MWRHWTPYHRYGERPRTLEPTQEQPQGICFRETGFTRVTCSQKRGSSPFPQKGWGTEHPPGASSVPGAHFHTLHLIGPQGWAEPPPCPGSGSCLEGHLAGVGQTCALWHPPGHLPLPMTMVKTESSVSSPVRSSVPHLCPFCLWWPGTWSCTAHVKAALEKHRWVAPIPNSQSPAALTGPGRGCPQSPWRDRVQAATLQRGRESAEGQPGAGGWTVPPGLFPHLGLHWLED